MARVDEIVIVLGHKPRELMEHIRAPGSGFKIILNEDYEEGMTSSFKVGLRLIRDLHAAFLVLGDQLILEPELLDRMIKEMECDQRRILIVSPVYRGRRGHPTLFSQRLFDEILGLGRDEILRDVIHRHSESLRLVEGGPWTVIDVDTPEDFERVKRLLGA